MKRRIMYVSGTRADFGLLEGTLQRIHRSPLLSLQIVATGMHLSPVYGLTVREIEAAGLSICARVPVDVETTDGAAMARAIGAEIIAFAGILGRERPDLLIVLGDRGEMLAGAIAALHLNIPVVHLHGGERSGTVDEPVRHAISKLVHFHFVATNGSRDRLIRMGERPDCIFVTGAPGLDDTQTAPNRSRFALAEAQGLDPDRPIALVVYHPVVQSADTAASEAQTVIEAVLSAGLQALCLSPNSDAGGSAIREVIASKAGQGAIRVGTHFSRTTFLAWMKAADVLVGNSSSGIIEAASFGLPVVNVGERQQGRERNANTCDVEVDAEAVKSAVLGAIKHGRYPPANVYGDGHAGERIVELLERLPIEPSILRKTNAY
jgi:GDP/UDP-N,N'-diacetylbacillosamine 2-epimerase (hydrolysing)